MNTILKDPIDQRDHVFAAAPSTPESVDNRKYIYDKENQDRYGSCGGQGAAAAMEITIKRFKPNKVIDLSPAYVWAYARLYRGDEYLLKNEGVFPRDVVKVLEQQGICPESVWPYEAKNFFIKPSAQADKVAKKLRIKSYARCTTEEQIKSAVAAGLPVCLAMQLRHGFENINGKLDTHLAQWEQVRSAPIYGGHFMVIVGYNKDGVYALNSWGVGRHDLGVVLIPWDVLMKDSFDFWAITGLKTWLDKLMSSIKSIFA